MDKAEVFAKLRRYEDALSAYDQLIRRDPDHYFPYWQKAKFLESIGQEVFLRAFRFAPTYRYPQKLSTWLFTITRNLAINSSRRRHEPR